MKTSNKSVIRQALGITLADYALYYLTHVRFILFVYSAVALPLVAILIYGGICGVMEVHHVVLGIGAVVGFTIPLNLAWYEFIEKPLHELDRWKAVFSMFNDYHTLLAYLRVINLHKMRPVDSETLVSRLNAMVAGLAGSTKHCQRNDNEDVAFSFRMDSGFLHSALQRAGLAESDHIGHYYK